MTVSTSKLRASLALVLLALNVLVGVLVLREPMLTVPIPAASMTPEIGHNTTAAVTFTLPFPYVFAFAGPSNSEGSPATVTEDDIPLGPSHALHSDIRAMGGGRYSLWSGAVYFSSHDNSDPRSNGRAYRLVAQARLPYRITLGVTVLDLFWIAVFRHAVARWLARRGTTLAAIVVAIAALRVLLGAVGWLPPVFDSSATAIDGGMAVSIAGHMLLGFALCCIVYAVGLGVLLWMDRRARSLAALLPRAFLPGLLVLAVAALAAIAKPGGAMVAAAVLLIAAMPLARYRPAPDELRRALEPMLFCGPAVALYAMVLSFRFHGPSGAIGGAPLGDETIYTGWANDLARNLSPVPNLAVEGYTTPYGNLLPCLLMVPLLGARWFDPYLFLSASLPILSLLALGLTAPLITRGSGDGVGRRWDAIDVLACAGLVAAMFRYPSILVESTPFALLLPIVVSTLYLAAPGRGRPRSWAALVTATLGTAVSKVVALPVLALLPAPDVAGLVLRRAGRRQIAVAFAFGTVVLVYVLVALRTYLPLFLRLGGLGPPSWEAIVRSHVADPISVACVVARDLGAVLLAAAWTRSRAIGLKLGVWAGVGLGFVMPFLFHTSLTTAVLVTALATATRVGLHVRARPCLLAAAALMLPQSVVAEGGGLAVTLAWVAVVVCLTAAMIRPEDSAVGLDQTLHRVAGAAALCCGLVLWGAGAGAIRVGPEALPFTSDMRDIWRAVRRDTPSDALLFTDQTGDTESRFGGWNDYALMAQRQFYIVSWANALRSDPEGRRTRLDDNARVLSGVLSPEALVLSRRYDSFYAVLDGHSAPPPRFVPVYRNPSFALYRILPQQGGGKAQ